MKNKKSDPTAKQSRTKQTDNRIDYIGPLPPEQLKLEGFPSPSDNASLPTSGSKSFMALMALLHGPLHQPAWSAQGMGWRLSAQVKDLDYHGFDVASIRIEHECCPVPIALYQLTKDSKQAAYRLLRAAGISNQTEAAAKARLKQQREDRQRRVRSGRGV
jgi:hypothetical protein